MAANTGTLTAVAIKNAKPGPKPRKLFDGGGMYLEVMPNGARYWRLKYRHAGKEKRLAMGVFPEVSLAEAREARDAARTAIRQGRDPGAERKASKLQAQTAGGNTFKAIAEEWLDAQRKTLSASTLSKAEWILGDLLYPHLGALPIGQVDAPTLLAVLRRIESTGARETAHRARSRCSQIFRYAVATGRAKRDPSSDLRGALAPPLRKSHAAITDPKKVGKLLRDLETYSGHPATCIALKLTPLLFVRPGELRSAEWTEIDLDEAEWRIPASKMKMGEMHVVPLPTQAIELFAELHKLTGRGRYAFPGSGKSPTMSENTVNDALRTLGYSGDVQTAHGFRTTASTLLNEMGWVPDVIERQLAHAERNKVRAVYNRAQYMAERRKMMQAWADFLDGLKAGTGKVVAFKRASA